MAQGFLHFAFRGRIAEAGLDVKKYKKSFSFSARNGF
jgi:hypothetical protein